MRIRLDLGTSPREALVDALHARGVRTNPYFDALLPRVVVADAPRPLTVAIASAAALGFPGGATLPELLAGVAVQALGPCPLEAALHLRLAYSDEPKGVRVTVVSPRVVDDEAFPRGLYLRRDDEGLWLRAFVASDDWRFDADEHFALAVMGATDVAGG